jgi:hypothetical protein
MNQNPSWWRFVKNGTYDPCEATPPTVRMKCRALPDTYGINGAGWPDQATHTWLSIYRLLSLFNSACKYSTSFNKRVNFLPKLVSRYSTRGGISGN